MKKLLALIIPAVMAITLFGCSKPSKCFLNGVNLEEFSIVYSDNDLDYSKRAAEYIRAEILERTGLQLPLVEDSESAASEYEIVVGNTERDISARLDADTSYFEESDVAEFVEREIHNEGHSASRCV